MIFAFPFPARAGENIRVVIADNQKSVTVRSSTGLMTEGDPQARVVKKIVFKAGAAGETPVRVKSYDERTGVNGRSYRGWIEIRKKRNGLLLVVNDLDIEEYLMGVIAEEIPHDWEAEALKAQAVASRSYAIYQKRNSGKRPYHILASVDGQVYGGRRWERQSAVQAVLDTRGLVLTYEGEVIPAFYHSSCGGHTESASELWGLDAPYLMGVDCSCQEISKYGVWEKRIPMSSIERTLERRGYKLRGIASLEMGSITPAGRVRDVTIRHSGGTKTVPAETLRAAIGYSRLPSSFFELEMSGAEIVLSGRGLGHGVGLCQWGAKYLARKGYDYQSILGHYYPGTILVKISVL